MSQTEGWMPLFVTRYLNDTEQLNTAQHGAYLLLLMHYWRHGPLEDNDDALAAIARMDCKTWRTRFAATIRKFFRHEDGLLFQKRMEVERARAADISGKRRAAAFASHNSPTTGGGNRADRGPKSNGANAPAPAPALAPTLAPAKLADETCKPGAIAPANAPAHAVSEGANAPALAPVHCTPYTSKNLSLLSFKEEEAAGAREHVPPPEREVDSPELAELAEVVELSPLDAAAIAPEPVVNPEMAEAMAAVIAATGKALGHVEYSPGAYQPIKPAIYQEAAKNFLTIKSGPKHLNRELLDAMPHRRRAMVSA